ncbi:MFS transporter [Labrenzia sp. PHM005]|uniref:MFS transporter n=1 Tax=Labrenzia sp. PHM005 TaxID=2590016 RepID=UPI00113FD551|nr:MFS transporter [Labrenzia sp. PHM005]QDG77875.1 MFS transporter [Labrenzia sp. PHM005]
MTARAAAVSSNRPETRLATRMVFFVPGFIMGAWSPLIPFAKLRTGLDEAGLGLLLLCLGIGSVVFMPLAGGLCTRFGARNVILYGGAGLCVVFPALGVLASVPSLIAAVFLIGGFLGLLEVAMNSHAVVVESASERPLMSGFHAQFSVGGFVGAGGMTLFLAIGLTPPIAALLTAGLALLILLFAGPNLLDCKGLADETTRRKRIPPGAILLLAALAAITFLIEGAVLDWSALLITEKGLVAISEGGIGFMVFSIAMMIGRLFGDRFVAAVGSRNTLFWGGALTIAGVLLASLGANIFIAMIGFLAIGFGASNIVPVLFSLAGRQRQMPSGQAIAVVATAGYAGILLGPAAIGFIADAIGLTLAFAGLAALLALVPLFAKKAAG